MRCRKEVAQWPRHRVSLESTIRFERCNSWHLQELRGRFKSIVTSFAESQSTTTELLRDSIVNIRNPLKLEEFNVDVVQDEILGEAKKFTNKNDDIEILSELQHYGGKTNLIDFTNDYRVALFFACDGSFDRAGRVVLCEKSSHQTVLPKKPENRIEAQKSVFIWAPKGFVIPEIVIDVPAKLKNHILDQLRQKSRYRYGNNL